MAMLLQHFGKYLLFDKIGAGGMAEVFLAKQTGLKGFEKFVAIKRILPHLTQDPEFISMFVNEAKLAALLTHQNIVQIFELAHVDNSYFIAMEYVMGKDLRTVSNRAKKMNQPLSVGQVLMITAKVCSGLDYAHRKKDLNGQNLNIVHRDISPQNILVSYEGEVKLVDFGIAKAASQTSETRAGFLKGKLSYMAPEQAWGKPVDRRTDVFAVGVVLYELLTGHKLFKGDNDFNTLEKIREAKVEPLPSQLNTQIGPELEAILLKSLAREPQDRFQSAADLQIALEDHCVQKGHDLSTVRLSQSLHGFFSEDLKVDNDRFRKASSGTDLPSLQDESTRIRKSPRQDQEPTPSPSRKRNEFNKLKKSNHKKLSSVRITVLSFIFVFLSTVWAADTDHFVLYSIKIRFPDTVRLFNYLDNLPEKITRMLVSLPLFKKAPMPQSGIPLKTSLPSGSRPKGLPLLPDADSSTLISTSFPEMDSNTGQETEPDERILTQKEREEVQYLFKEAQENYKQGRLNEVERNLRRILELNPRNSQAYHFLGTLFIERKDHEEALRIFSEASRIFPNNASLHFDLGFLYFNQGIISLAIDELNKALALNPEGPKAKKARQILNQFEQTSGTGSMPVKAPSHPGPSLEEESQ